MPKLICKSNDFDRGAFFSKDRQYRYVLWRHWEPADLKKSVMFIGLNPSKADETNDDITITKCIRFGPK